MTDSTHKVFVDYRSPEQINAGLATPILTWYDKEGHGRKRRRRTNGIAITTEGLLVYADAVCSRQDQFVKSHGRMVVEQRMLGQAKDHYVTILVNPEDEDRPKATADAYRELFPNNETGAKRAYNVGKMFVAYREEIKRRADELDEF